MGFMFNGCSSLKELNLSNFNTNNFTNRNNLFYDISKNCKIIHKENISKNK